jgi:hypothetical protein
MAVNDARMVTALDYATLRRSEDLVGRMRSVLDGEVAVLSVVHLHGLTHEDGEVVGRGWSRAAHMFVILRLTWRLTDER